MEEEEGEEVAQGNKKQNLFSFAKINKYFILPFICPIFCMCANFFIYFIREEEGIRYKEFSIIMMIFFGYLFGGLLYFISAIRTRTEETKNNAIIYREREPSKASLKLIFNAGDKKNKFKIFGFIVCISSFLCIIEVFSLYSFDKKVFELRLYFLIFIPIFSKNILKIDIYNHQILSLFIAIIGMIFLFIPIFLEIGKDDIIINICLFLSSIGYSLHLVLIKYLTHNYYLSPYLCLLLIICDMPHLLLFGLQVEEVV